MRRWGLVVTLFYVVVILVLVVPGTIVFGFFPHVKTLWQLRDVLKNTYAFWGVWLVFGILILGQVLLLWLSVDTTRGRLKPRTHILISATTTALLLALLTSAVLFSLTVVVWGDDADQKVTSFEMLAGFLVPWLLWGILFYRLTRDADDAVTRAISWLMRGSVLELLIAVPSHVIVRRRDDCCAPIVTGYGIAAGNAIMLLSFGPSVLLLYKKRIEARSLRTAVPGSPSAG